MSHSDWSGNSSRDLTLGNNNNTAPSAHLLLRRERGVGQRQLQLVHGHEGVVAVHPVQVANCHSWEVNLISVECIKLISVIV